MSDLISRQAVSDIIKIRLYQTALNNTEYFTSYDKVCEDIAENRIDTWINEAKSIEPEKCGACISRQAVLEQINCWIGSGEYRYTNATSYLAKRMQDISPVTPKPCDDCISRQDVLDLAKCGRLVSNGNYKSVCDAINGLPSVEPEKCGDCISRRAIIGKCEDTAEATSDSGEMNTGFIMALDFIADYAKHLPSVEPERKTGHWHLLDECANEGWYCDQCNKKVFRADFSNTMKKYKFCPNCGSYNG